MNNYGWPTGPAIIWLWLARRPFGWPRATGKPDPCLQHFYSLGSEILQEVSDAKYLGIQIDNKLDWNKHNSTVAARGQSKLAFLNLTGT